MVRLDGKMSLQPIYQKDGMELKKVVDITMMKFMVIRKLIIF